MIKSKDLRKTHVDHEATVKTEEVDNTRHGQRMKQVLGSPPFAFALPAQGS